MGFIDPSVSLILMFVVEQEGQNFFLFGDFIGGRGGVSDPFLRYC